MDELIMNRKEREQMIVFEQFFKKEILQKNADQMISLCRQWVREKLSRYRLNGALGLVHVNRSKPSQQRFNASHRTLLVNLLKGPCIGFGPTFAAENLFPVMRDL